MDKRKSVFVTALCAAMLAVIVAGMHKILMVGFWIIVGAFALYGFARCAVDFCGWLGAESKEKPLEPVFGDPLPDDYTATYDEIAAEVRAER